jgi:hypothetical protein
MRLALSLAMIGGAGEPPEPPIPVPENTEAPAVTGTFKIGQTLSVSDGTWDGSPSSYAYQWTRDGDDISGATSNTHLLAADDDESFVTAKVRAANDGGASAWVTATGGAGVTYPAPTFSVQPSFTKSSYIIGEEDAVFSLGTAGPDAHLEVELFTLDDVDREDDLLGNTFFPTEGEPEGTLALQVRATNSGGFTLSDTVTADIAEAGEAPVILSASITDNVLSVLTDIACDLYYWITTDSSETASDVVTNGDFITLTDTDQDIEDIDDGLADGTWYVHLVARADSLNSAVSSVSFVVANAPTTWAAVVGDGDYLTRSSGAGFTGTKQKILFAANVVRQTGSATLGYIVHWDGSRDFAAAITSTGELRVTCGASSWRVPGAAPTTGDPETIIMSVDMTAANAAAGVKFYRGSTKLTTFTNEVWTSGTDIPAAGFSSMRWFNNNTAASVLYAELGFGYLDAPASLPDIDDSAVRALFAPGTIGSNGSGPTGSQPLEFITGPASGIATNKGSASGYTATGTFVDA